MQTWGDLGSSVREFVPIGRVRERRGGIQTRVRTPRTLMVGGDHRSLALGAPHPHLAMPALRMSPAADGMGIERIDVTVPNLRGTTSWGWLPDQALPWWSLTVGAAQTSEAGPRPRRVTVWRLADWTWRVEFPAPTARDRVDTRRPTGWWLFAAADADCRQVSIMWDLRSGPRHLRGEVSCAEAIFPLEIPKSRWNGDQVAGRVSRLAFIRRPPLRGWGGVVFK